METEDKVRMLESQIEFTNAHNNEMQTQIGRNMCEIANMLVELAVKDAEIERLKGLHNPELVPAAAHMICAQRDEIERLKGLLREAADDLDDWGLYVPEYYVERHRLDDDIKKYRLAGEVTK